MTTSRNTREGRYLGRFGCWIVRRDGSSTYARRHFRTRENDALRVPPHRRAARR